LGSFKTLIMEILSHKKVVCILKSIFIICIFIVTTSFICVHIDKSSDCYSAYYRDRDSKRMVYKQTIKGNITRFDWVTLNHRDTPYRIDKEGEKVFITSLNFPEEKRHLQYWFDTNQSTRYYEY
jgi:hypothetical protein